MFFRELRYITNIVKYYAKADLRAKQEIIGSIYPEKMVFEENTLRTNRVNDVVEWMCRPVADSSDPKNRECPEKSGHSTVVPGTGELSNRLMLDFLSFSSLRGKW